MALTFLQTERACSPATTARVKGSTKLSVLMSEDTKDSKCYNSVLSLERFNTGFTRIEENEVRFF